MTDPGTMIDLATRAELATTIDHMTTGHGRPARHTPARRVTETRPDTVLRPATRLDPATIAHGGHRRPSDARGRTGRHGTDRHPVGRAGIGRRDRGRPIRAIILLTATEDPTATATRTAGDTRIGDHRMAAIDIRTVVRQATGRRRRHRHHRRSRHLTRSAPTRSWSPAVDRSRRRSSHGDRRSGCWSSRTDAQRSRSWSSTRPDCASRSSRSKAAP